MHERALRTVLLIRAIEESDPAGEVLPLADRDEATRTVMREPRAATATASASLDRREERLLAARAERLRERLEMRSPVIGHVLDLASGSRHVGRLMLVAALLIGAGLAALDGSRRINILAFPLLGLIAWNLLVYVILIADRVRRRSSTGHSSVLTRLYEHWVQSRTRGLLSRSSMFNAPLATALRRFVADWTEVAHPLIVLRAKRLFHLAAACVAIGLIIGLYVRGIALRYEAGWESTFLGPEAVRVLLLGIYGPAAALSGLTLPQSAEEVSTLRWTGADGGGDAALWIHLIAITAALYIILPRVLAAFAATLALWRAARSPAVPPSLHRYARNVIGRPERVQSVADVIPYSYEPSDVAVAGLERVLAAALGNPVHLNVHAAVHYGDEDYLPALSGEGSHEADRVHVLLFNLASTPEEENHGQVLTRLRDLDDAAAKIVIVDEGPFAIRVGGDASLEPRVEERRNLWRTFVARHGMQATLVDLNAMGSDAAADPRTIASVHAALEAPR